MLQISAFLALAFAIVIAIFAVQNTRPVDVSFLFFSASQVAVSVLVLVSAALGAGVMLLLGAAREVRVRLRQRNLTQQIKTLQSRVRDLESAAPVPSPAALPASPDVPTLELQAGSAPAAETG